MHKPLDLDTASSLAMLQEELLGDMPRKEVRRNENFQAFRTVPKHSPMTPLTPSSSTRTPQYGSPEEKQHVESMKVQRPEEIMSAIKAYRRAKGLCYKCGMKWGPGHKCAPTVALHFVEELWQMLQHPGSPEQMHQEVDSDSGDELMCVSSFAVDGSETTKTIKVLGNLQGFQPLILLDSGSSCNFISEHMVVQISGWSPLPQPVQVKVADGALICCTHEVKNCQLYIQGHCFVVDLKILPLKCYDIILGMVWLELYSPMEVHWQDKWLSFSYLGV